MPLLDPKFLLNEKFKVPKTLRLDHDEMRLELGRAASRAGPMGRAAQGLKRLCLPHFDTEEKTVYPAFTLLHDVALSGVRTDMAAVLPLIFHCSAWHGELLADHQPLVTAVEALQMAIEQEKDSEFAALADALKSHEKLEEEVMYPALTWLGHYIRERLQASE